MVFLITHNKNHNIYRTEGKALGVEFLFTPGTFCEYFVHGSKFVQSHELNFVTNIFILKFLALHFLLSKTHLPENNDEKQV